MPKTSKPAAAKVKVKRQAMNDERDVARARADELLAKPFTAFVLFGFAQRNLLKKQKPGATVKEVVKAVGVLVPRSVGSDASLQRPSHLACQVIAGSS